LPSENVAKKRRAIELNKETYRIYKLLSIIYVLNPQKFFQVLKSKPGENFQPMFFYVNLSPQK